MLAAAGAHVLAVAGHNAALERRLRDLSAGDPAVHPFGFSDAMPTLMAAIDVVVSASGANTCSEARTVGRPMVLLDVVPGHGRENLQHELEQGGAEVCNARAPDIVVSVLAMLERAGNEALAVTSPEPWGPPFLQALSSVGVKLAT
jgi:UDP-N-acetylglucosamine:LPS N-acetylglucosamine transferase